MAEFAYNKAKNTIISYSSFKLNCWYYFKVFFEDKNDPHLRSCFVNKLVDDLKKLVKIGCQNLLYAQELQKKTYNKIVKSRSYTLNEKVWLNSKYIKIK